MQVMLDEQVSVNLWKNYKEEPTIDARNKIVLLYAGLVKSIARRAASVSGSYVDLEDLVSFGMLGLIKAVEKYDIDKGVSFETYATYRVRGEIIDYMRRNDWVPRGVRKRAQDIEKATEAFKNTNNREPTQDELCVTLGVKRNDITQVLSDCARLNTISFEEMIQETVKTDRNLICDETPEEALAQGELLEQLAEAIDSLPERERLVIALYYHEELTLKEISSIMSVSESRVSQLHTRAVKNLKKALNEYTGH